SVNSAKTMRSISVSPALSNRHNSTFVALAENKAKFTPSPFQVAPSGKGRPSRRRDRRSACRLAISVNASITRSLIGWVGGERARGWEVPLDLGGRPRITRMLGGREPARACRQPTPAFAVLVGALRYCAARLA